MIAAGMASTAVITTGVAFAMFMIVVAAADIGVKVQLTGKESFYSFVGLAGNAAVKADVGSCQCHLCAAADAAADQNIGIQCAQNTGQCAVTAAVGVHHLCGNHLAILYIINFELLGVAKMLENHTVFIGNCNSHNGISFRFAVLLIKLLLETRAAVAETVFSIAKTEISAFDA